MKTLTFLKKGCLLLLILTMLGCGQMSSPVNVSPLTKDDDNQDVNIDPALIGGTNTGSSIDETAVESPVTISSPLALKIEATGSAIIPKIGTSSSTTSSLVLSGLSYNTDDHWSIFFEPYYDYTLPYIFGPLDQKWVAETQLRYLLKHFTENPFVELLDYDPSGCAWHDPPEEEDEGQYGPWSLAEDDWITIAFFGDVSNGTKEDRFFDCAAAGPTYYNEGQPDQSDVYLTVVYGIDNTGVTRMVIMEEETGRFIVEDEGINELRIKNSVFYVTYGEKIVDDETKAYLDIQYAQAVHYSGDDDTFDADGDDTYFKSRTRLTGHAVFSMDGEVLLSKGEFTVTGYHKPYDGTGDDLTSITKSMGRGEYADGDISLFQINTDRKEKFVDANGVYCIEMISATGQPLSVNKEQCQSLETNFSWGAEPFPFEINPVLEQDFAEKDFFEEEDLIKNDMSNFSVPVYKTLD